MRISQRERSANHGSTRTAPLRQSALLASSMRTFAFGRPVLPRPPSASEPRRAFVLKAYPSGLHVKWTPSRTIEGQRFKPVQAMIVDNDPWPFWDGADAHEQFTRWRTEVDWQDKWGAVEPADPRFNGPSGTWVAEHILAPFAIVHLLGELVHENLKAEEQPA